MSNQALRRVLWPRTVFGLAAAWTSVGLAVALPVWQQARNDEATAPISSSEAVFAAQTSDNSVCHGAQGNNSADGTPPSPSAVLAELRRSFGTSAIHLGELRFEQMTSAESGSRWLQVSGSMQGTYAGGKDGLRAVIDRYPGAVLDSLRIQRVPASLSDVKWQFSLRLAAVSNDSDAGAVLTCAPVVQPPVAAASRPLT